MTPSNCILLQFVKRQYVSCMTWFKLRGVQTIMSDHIRNHKDVSFVFRCHLRYHIKLQMSDSISRRSDLIEMCASKSVWRNSGTLKTGLPAEFADSQTLLQLLIRYQQSWGRGGEGRVMDSIILTWVTGQRICHFIKPVSWTVWGSTALLLRSYFSDRICVTIFTCRVKAKEVQSDSLYESEIVCLLLGYCIY